MLNGSNSKSLLRASSSLASSQVTRGGVSKRVFKPNIPVKVDRSKDEDKQEDKSESSDTKSHLKKNKIEFDKKNNFKKKEYIQLEGTFEDVKSEGKIKQTNGYGGGASSSISSVTGGGGPVVKGEQTKRIKVDDETKREKKLEFGREAKAEDYLSDEVEDENLGLDDQDMPISWTSYNKMLDQFNNLNKEENNVEEKLANGRLILMPCIFGDCKAGDTGYKLQVLKSGKMRLVDKKSGFTVDLLNTGNLENDAIKEVVELDDDKLLRYGSLTNTDIYSPVRNLNSDYNSILQD